TVSLQVLSRNDDTGETTLRIRPLHADGVLVSEIGPPTSMSKRLEHYDLPTTATRLWFLATDSQNPSRVGEPEEWKSTVTIKHRISQDGEQRRCELRAIPSGDLRYTMDGSSPETSGLAYDGPFVLTRDARVVLAVADGDGVRSAVTRFDLPEEGQSVVVD